MWANSYRQISLSLYHIHILLVVFLWRTLINTVYLNVRQLRDTKNNFILIHNPTPTPTVFQYNYKLKLLDIFCSCQKHGICVSNSGCLLFWGTYWAQFPRYLSCHNGQLLVLDSFWLWVFFFQRGIFKVWYKYSDPFWEETRSQRLLKIFLLFKNLCLFCISLFYTQKASSYSPLCLVL